MCLSASMQYVYVVTAAWVCPLLALHSCNLFVCLSDVFAVTCVLTLHTVSYSALCTKRVRITRSNLVAANHDRRRLCVYDRDQGRH